MIDITLAAALALALAVPQAGAADDCQPDVAITAELAKAGDKAIVSYEFARNITCLRMAEGGRVRQMTWRVLTPGARLSDDGETLVLDQAAQAVQVELSPFARDGQLDRVYSPVIAFGDRSAVAVYSGYLQPASAKAGFALRYAGFSPLAPMRRVGDQVGGPAPSYLIVGAPQLLHRGHVTLAMDRAMPTWLQSRVLEDIEAAGATLKAAVPVPRNIAYLITHTEPTVDAAQWRGDVLGSLVRLNFIGERWQKEDLAYLPHIRQFVLHELFHTANRNGEPMSLTEGAAEAAAATLQRRRGALGREAYAARAEAALQGCLAIPGATLADKERANQRRAPYQCGEALQHIAATMLRKNGPAQPDLLDLWSTLLKERKDLRYGWNDFFAALRTLSPVKARARIALLEDLANNRSTWNAAVMEFSDNGTLRPPTSKELAEPHWSAFYAKQAVFHFLSTRCTGQHGMYPSAKILTLDAPPATCTGVPDKFRLFALNGHAVENAGHAAFLDTVRRCAAGQALELRDEQGNKVEIACSTPFTGIEGYKFNF